MDAVRIVIIGIVATVLILVFRHAGKKNEYGLYISVCTGIIIFYLLFDKLAILLNLMTRITSMVEISDVYLKILLQILGVSFITEFGAGLCKDAGQEAISNNIQLAGRVLILILSMPVLLAIINMINDILV